MGTLTVIPSNIQEKPFISSHLLEKFSQYIDGKPRTVESYTQAIKQFYKWIQDKDITQPTRADILVYRDHLRTTHKPNTTQNYIIALHQFFRWTAQEGFYPDIADNVKGAKIDQEHKKDPLTVIQIKNILAAIDTTTTQGKRDYAIIGISVTGGTRTIELQRANIEDIRIAENNKVLYIQGKGRDEKTEYIKLSQPVEKALISYIKSRGDINPGEPLFVSHSDRNEGKRLTTRSISRLIKTRFIDAGYNDDRLSAHSLRHTAATLNLLNGGSLQDTQQLLRHQNVNTTLIYVHNLERAKNQSEKRISEVIF